MKSKFININGAPYGKQVSLWLRDSAGLGGVSTICKEEEICKANSCTCGQDWCVCVFNIQAAWEEKYYETLMERISYHVDRAFM